MQVLERVGIFIMAIWILVFLIAFLLKKYRK